MTTFTPDKPVTLKDIFYSVLIIVVITAFVLIIDALFKTSLIRHSYYFTISVLILISIADFLGTYRVQKVSFDPAKKEVYIMQKSFLTGFKEKLLPFENMRIEVRSVKVKNSSLRKPTKLFVLKNRAEACAISTGKDGFSGETLKAIIQQAEQCSIPITRL